jgi:hypothetical protein
MIRSVEVGIQRRTVGHNDLDFADVTVAAADDPISAFLISSVILFDHRMRVKLMDIGFSAFLTTFYLYIYSRLARARDTKGCVLFGYVSDSLAAERARRAWTFRKQKEKEGGVR